MLDDQWIFRTCPRCSHAWQVQRMPSDAQAADILRLRRRTRSLDDLVARSPFLTCAGPLRAVQLYQDADSLYRVVAAFLVDGLQAAERAIVIATPSHRDGLLNQLTALSLDAQRCQRVGDLLLLDANETISEFTTDGAPDAARFIDVTVKAAEKVFRRQREFAVRIYAELVDIPRKSLNHEASMRAEALWYRVAARDGISVLSDCAAGYFHSDDGRSEHLSADGQTASVETGTLQRQPARC